MADRPVSLKDLQKRIREVASRSGTTERRTNALIANAVVGQMLPDSAVKGGTGLKLRFGDTFTRETPDLDTAFRGDRMAFLAELKTNLTKGWSGFGGDAVLGTQRDPVGLTSRLGAAYVMQPVAVTLTFAGRTFKRVDIEIGHDELAATTDEPVETAISQEHLDLFAVLGLDQPRPVRVLPLHHQFAQKLHACTEPGSQRAHDLVDLQLMATEVDAAKVSAAAQRLFAFRQQHVWKPTVVANADWAPLYADAASGLAHVAPTVSEAVVWANDYLAKLP